MRPTPAPPSSPRGSRPTAGSAGSSPIASSPSPRSASPTRRPRAGAARFGDVARECLRVGGRTRSSRSPRGLPAGAGPVWTGGFAFDPEGARLLALVLARRRRRWSCPSSRSAAAARRSFLTVNLVVGPGDDPEAAAERAAGTARRPAAEQPLPLIDPHPTERAGDPQRPPAGRLRAGRRRGDRADRRRRDEQGRPRPRGVVERRPPRTTRRRSSARCASSSRPASASAAARRRRPSSAPAPSS